MAVDADLNDAIAVGFGTVDARFLQRLNWPGQARGRGRRRPSLQAQGQRRAPWEGHKAADCHRLRRGPSALDLRLRRPADHWQLRRQSRAPSADTTTRTAAATTTAAVPSTASSVAAAVAASAESQPTTLAVPTAAAAEATATLTTTPTVAATA